MNTSIFLRGSVSAYASATQIDSRRTGEVSPDRTAVIGAEGWCFIYEGTNNYRGAYLDASLAALGDEWARVIEKRHHACERHEARFVQLVVPNKASSMPERYPEPIGKGATPMLLRLLQAAPVPRFLCPMEQFRSSELRDSVYRRNDSHLTAAGNAILSELILAALGIELGPVAKIDVKTVTHEGDLGSKFLSPITEALAAPQFGTGLFDQNGLTKTHETLVEGFNGIRQIFQNSTAPIKKKVVIFGNSFFERVPSWGMSPLFAALFGETHFLWTADYEESYVQAIAPDFVICQTCERFLNRLPRC